MLARIESIKLNNLSMDSILTATAELELQFFDIKILEELMNINPTKLGEYLEQAVLMDKLSNPAEVTVKMDGQVIVDKINKYTQINGNLKF